MKVGRPIKRRRFLQGVAAAGVSAVGVSALAGCGGDGGGNGDSADASGGVRGSGLELPRYQRFEGVEPDLPGDENGVPDGFFRYPRPAEPATDGPPGGGGTVTAMYDTALAAPVPMGRNDWWDGLNERLGVELAVELTPSADYAAKLATAQAGGDLPDLVRLPAGQVPRLPDLLAAEFEDLTEYLSGDAVLDYPFLANLPEYMWRTTIFNGAIHAVPPPNLVGQPTWLVRLDVLDAMGAELSAEDADDVFDLCVQVTDEQTNQYAFASPHSVINNLAAVIFETPNIWGVDDGAFVHMFETDEYKAALEYTARLWEAGTLHPDSFGSANFPELFMGGSIAFASWGGVGYRNVLRAEPPGLELGFWAPPKAEGGGVAPKRLATGTFGLCGIRKQDSPERVRELLAILNYLAVPFGTAEHLYINHGEEGVHHDWDNDLQVPVETEKFGAERLQTSPLAGAPHVLFDPGYTDATQAMYEHQQETIPTGVRDASVGLYSATDDSDGPGLTQAVEDVRNDLVQGRVSFDDWDRAVADWRSGGGDAMRAEYETAHAELQESLGGQ